MPVSVAINPPFPSIQVVYLTPSILCLFFLFLFIPFTPVSLYLTTFLKDYNLVPP